MRFSGPSVCLALLLVTLCCASSTGQTTPTLTSVQYTKHNGVIHGFSSQKLDCSRLSPHGLVLEFGGRSTITLTAGNTMTCFDNKSFLIFLEASQREQVDAQLGQSFAISFPSARFYSHTGVANIDVSRFPVSVATSSNQTPERPHSNYDLVSRDVAVPPPVPQAANGSSCSLNGFDLSHVKSKSFYSVEAEYGGRMYTFNFDLCKALAKPCNNVTGAAACVLFGTSEQSIGLYDTQKISLETTKRVVRFEYSGGQGGRSVKIDLRCKNTTTGEWSATADPLNTEIVGSSRDVCAVLDSIPSPTPVAPSPAPPSPTPSPTNNTTPSPAPASPSPAQPSPAPASPSPAPAASPSPAAPSPVPSPLPSPPPCSVDGVDLSPLSSGDDYHIYGPKLEYQWTFNLCRSILSPCNGVENVAVCEAWATGAQPLGLYYSQEISVDKAKNTIVFAYTGGANGNTVSVNVACRNVTTGYWSMKKTDPYHTEISGWSDIACRVVTPNPWPSPSPNPAQSPTPTPTPASPTPTPASPTPTPASPTPTPVSPSPAPPSTSPAPSPVTPPANSSSPTPVPSPPANSSSPTPTPSSSPSSNSTTPSPVPSPSSACSVNGADLSGLEGAKDYTAERTSGGQEYSYTFNFCKPINITCGGDEVSACQSWGTGSQPLGLFSTQKITADDSKKAVVFAYSGGEGGRTASLIVTCKDGADTGDWTVTEPDPLKTEISGVSKVACLAFNGGGGQSPSISPVSSPSLSPSPTPPPGPNVTSNSFVLFRAPEGDKWFWILYGDNKTIALQSYNQALASPTPGPASPSPAPSNNGTNGTSSSPTPVASPTTAPTSPTPVPSPSTNGTGCTVNGVDLAGIEGASDYTVERPDGAFNYTYTFNLCKPISINCGTPGNEVAACQSWGTGSQPLGLTNTQSITADDSKKAVVFDYTGGEGGRTVSVVVTCKDGTDTGEWSVREPDPLKTEITGVSKVACAVFPASAALSKRTSRTHVLSDSSHIHARVVVMAFTARATDSEWPEPPTDGVFDSEAAANATLSAVIASSQNTEKYAWDEAAKRLTLTGANEGDIVAVKEGITSEAEFNAARAIVETAAKEAATKTIGVEYEPSPAPRPSGGRGLKQYQLALVIAGSIVLVAALGGFIYMKRGRGKGHDHEAAQPDSYSRLVDDGQGSSGYGAA